MEQRKCNKCGLLQKYDPIFGLVYCDSESSQVFGCPTPEQVKQMSLSNLISELVGHNELRNNIRILHFGAVIKRFMSRNNCTLDEVIYAAGEAAKEQIGNGQVGYIL